MSTTRRGTIGQQPELYQKQKAGQAGWPFGITIDPDLPVIMAFATIGLLLAVCGAIAFPPPSSEVLAWL
jgi:hypothetical protein